MKRLLLLVPALLLGLAAPAGATDDGYRLVAGDGGVFSFGTSRFHGSTGAMRLNRPIVGMAETPSGQGYWLVASDGGIFAFGDAAFHGSTGALPLAQPIVGMTATPSGRGYWLLGRKGAVFSFGDAAFHGTARVGAATAVSLVPVPTGRGYCIVTSDARVSSFGECGQVPLRVTTAGPIVDATKLNDTWLLLSQDGGVHTTNGTGNQVYGSYRGPARRFVGLRTTANGYWLVSAEGGVFPFGDARDLGSLAGRRLNRPVVGT